MAKKTDDIFNGFITPDNFNLTAEPKKKLQIPKRVPSENLLTDSTEPTIPTTTEPIKLQLRWSDKGIEEALENFDPAKCDDIIINQLVDQVLSNIKALKKYIEQLNEK
jgi:hypothetical protein